MSIPVAITAIVLPAEACNADCALPACLLQLVCDVDTVASRSPTTRKPAPAGTLKPRGLGKLKAYRAVRRTRQRSCATTSTHCLRSRGKAFRAAGRSASVPSKQMTRAKPTCFTWSQHQKGTADTEIAAQPVTSRQPKADLEHRAAGSQRGVAMQPGIALCAPSSAPDSSRAPLTPLPDQLRGPCGQVVWVTRGGKFQGSLPGALPRRLRLLLHLHDDAPLRLHLLLRLLRLRVHSPQLLLDVLDPLVDVGARLLQVLLH